MSDVGLFTRCCTRIVGKGEPNSDVRFFTKCNMRLMGKAGTRRDMDWAKEDRLRMLARPMGEIRKHYDMNYTLTKWIPDYRRLRRLKKEVQGPLQKSCIRRRYDHTGSLIYPPNIERHVIKRYLNSFGEIVKIYDTDGECTIDKVL